MQHLVKFPLHYFKQWILLLLGTATLNLSVLRGHVALGKHLELLSISNRILSQLLLTTRLELKKNSAAHFARHRSVWWLYLVLRRSMVERWRVLWVACCAYLRWLLDLRASESIDLLNRRGIFFLITGRWGIYLIKFFGEWVSRDDNWNPSVRAIGLALNKIKAGKVNFNTENIALLDFDRLLPLSLYNTLDVIFCDHDFILWKILAFIIQFF